MASSCPCQAGARPLGACWWVQATLQSDPLNQIREHTAPLRGTLWWPQPAGRSQDPVWGALH